MQTVHISIAENGGNVPMRVAENGGTLGIDAEQARVIGAVSPTVDVQRTVDGVEIIVHDIRGTQPAILLYDGQPGQQGEPGQPGQPGEPGPQGDPGVGVPTGGTAGQVLAKSADGDYLTEWIDAPSGGPLIQTGHNAFSAAVKSGYGDLEIEFPEAFKAETTPTVMVCLCAGSITNTNAANVSLWVMSRTVTETGFTVRFFNSSVTNITPTVNWIAIGEQT